MTKKIKSLFQIVFRFQKLFTSENLLTDVFPKAHPFIIQKFDSMPNHFQVYKICRPGVEIQNFYVGCFFRLSEKTTNIQHSTNYWLN
jgi:hypothetical protein